MTPPGRPLSQCAPSVFTIPGLIYTLRLIVIFVLTALLLGMVYTAIRVPLCYSTPPHSVCDRLPPPRRGKTYVHESSLHHVTVKSPSNSAEAA